MARRVEMKMVPVKTVRIRAQNRSEGTAGLFVHLFKDATVPAFAIAAIPS